jgi:D-alanine--poly(phosphoribitol) ligase subunit 2
MKFKNQIHKVIEVINKSIDELNNQVDCDLRLEKSINTALMGSGGKLDSLGLINLIIAIEQNIEDEFDTSITLADERAMSQEHSPFKTVGSLADYIEMLLEEKLNV